MVALLSGLFYLGASRAVEAFMAEALRTPEYRQMKSPQVSAKGRREPGAPQVHADLRKWT
jgi:hypothetical protein